MNTGYEIYLMTKLASLPEIGLIEEELPYDEEWERGERLYGMFIKSEFNKDTQPLYECILEFLKKQLENRVQYCIFDFDGGRQYLHKIVDNKQEAEWTLGARYGAIVYNEAVKRKFIILDDKSTMVYTAEIQNMVNNAQRVNGVFFNFD